MYTPSNQKRASGDAPVVLTQVLTAGETSVTFTDAVITSTAFFNIYTENPAVHPVSIDDDTANTLIIGYEAQEDDLTVCLAIFNYI